MGLVPVIWKDIETNSVVGTTEITNFNNSEQTANWKSQIVTSNPSHNDGAKILMSQIATAKQTENKTITLLRSQFATTKDISKIRTLPYAFTREGIGMLSSVLGSDTAIEMNIRIMRVFTAAHQIMENNAILFQKVLHIEQHQLETDEKIEHILTKMEDNSPKQLPEQIFQTGCVWDAWSYVSDLVRSAKQRIVLNMAWGQENDIKMDDGRGMRADD